MEKECLEAIFFSITFGFCGEFQNTQKIISIGENSNISSHRNDKVHLKKEKKMYVKL